MISKEFSKGSEEVFLRYCVLLGFSHKPLPKGFRSHELLQAYKMSPTHFSYCQVELSQAVIMLAHHNIENNKPAVWVPDLKYLTLFAEGIKWLNNVPFKYIKQAGLDPLYDLWKEIPHAHDQLGGFVAIMLSMCQNIQELLGLLGFFDTRKYLDGIYYAIFMA
jgi:hypothetical protein